MMLLTHLVYCKASWYLQEFIAIRFMTFVLLPFGNTCISRFMPSSSGGKVGHAAQQM